MKEKFEIKNLLGNKQKRTYRREVFRYYRAGFVLCLIIMALVYCATTFKTQDTLLSPLGQTISNPVVKVLADEDKRYCGDAISYIRCSGEDLKKSNKEIMTMIRIAQKESGMNPKAKNKSSSASGLFQIIAGTWYSNDCVGDKYDYKDNTDCAWKIQTKRGFQPWEVCTLGLVDCN